MKTYSVIDLFAGAGGLSLGFKQTERFNIAVAAENNKNAQNTYKKNHPNVVVMDDVRQINYLDIRKKYGSVDVVIGGPPCQGFSNANRQKTQAISTNNSLVKEFVRAVCELKPKAFVMENVGMLRSSIHRFYYSRKDQNLIDFLKIELRKDKFLLLPASFCCESASGIEKSLDRFRDFQWDDTDYSVINILYRQRNNYVKLGRATEKYKKRLLAFAEHLLEKCKKNMDYALWVDEYQLADAIKTYFEKKCSHSDRLIAMLERPLMVQRMYRYYQELIDNDIIIDSIGIDDGIYANVSSYPVFEYIKNVLESSPYEYKISAKILNAADYGAPQKRERYIVIGICGTKEPQFPKPSIENGKYRTVFDAIADLQYIKTTTEVSDPPVMYRKIPQCKDSPLDSLRNSNQIYNHVITFTQETAMERYKSLRPGENFHDLDDSLKSTYTDAKRTQNTIYLRLKYNEPCGTVLNVRKSMWIHPTLNRALSIREAARLQTFPDDFIFTGTKDSQYQQVGNAVPPMLANAIAKQIVALLDGMRNGR